MPHQCIRCNILYADNAKEIASGCTCGGKLFFYVKQGKAKETKKLVEHLSDEQKGEMEDDVADLLGHDIDEAETAVIDLESVRSVGPGKYEIDLQQLLSDGPAVHKVGEGKYWVDLAEAFEKIKKK